MNYNNLTADIWNDLDISGSLVSGYKSAWLSLSDNEESDLHIFKDELGHYHLAIKVSGLRSNDIEDPGVNGLQVSLAQYRFGDGEVNQFIDVRCAMESYLHEFTEVIKEIAHNILMDEEKPRKAIKHVISSWVSFWANLRKEILSEEDQIGLLCELLLLEKLCIVNSRKALNAWTGPLGEKHDFNFTDWNFEVKGTRRKGRIHTVNGIEQLQPLPNKKLGFVSFMVSLGHTDSENTISLPRLIEKITHDNLNGKPALVARFNELLAVSGYNPVHREDYIEFDVGINRATFYEVDDDFPRLTTNMFNDPLNTRVTKVRYDISLEGIKGLGFDKISIGKYFY